MSWIDVHTHLQMLEEPVELCLREARACSVKYLINIGTSDKDWASVLKWVNNESVFGALGMHPHEAKTYTDEVENLLKTNLKSKGVIGVGEIGLDYYYEHSDKKVQLEVFRRQMEIAKELSFSVEIHTRDAEEDTIKVLKEYQGDVKGLLHCFTGSLDMAKKALDIGYNISFSGILTFKNAGALRDVCKYVPIDRLHVETDAPYLSPIPHRGKTNKPCYLVHTGELMAQIKQVPVQRLKEQTLDNAQKLFNFTLPPSNK